ncbi:helix-turn-helix domain-containing protein [Pseudomonas weihenstephanensis]|uniref:helix-turn-helix domain-containing protein n=1 Tax=Pseudomonas weihenstephanensis TaxID=1608994 RepID=UPI0030845D89
MTDSNTAGNHSTAAQAKRLVQALRAGPVSSIDAARSLDIVHPPSSVRWLRNNGYSIKTEWTYKTTEPGRRPHRVGLYVLASEPS